MATRIKIATPEDTLIHFDTWTNSYTLCGLETSGDERLRIAKGTRTEAKVTCPACIRIVEFCHEIKRTEYKKTKP